MRRFLLILLLALGNVNSSIAAIYTYIDSIEGWEGASGTYIVTAVIEWDMNDSTPNPCYGKYSCDIQASVMPSPSTPAANWLVNLWTLNTSGSDSTCFVNAATIGDLGKCIESNPPTLASPRTGTWDRVAVFTTYTNYPAACSNIYYRYQQSSATGDTSYESLPGVVCGLAPPPLGVCSMSDSIELDHGIVSNTQLDNNEATQSFHIVCNQDMTVSLKMTNVKNGYIPIADNLNSSIKVNNVDINKSDINLSLPTGTTNLDMTSILSTTGTVSAGDYSAQSVLIMTIN